MQHRFPPLSPPEPSRSLPLPNLPWAELALGLALLILLHSA